MYQWRKFEFFEEKSGGKAAVPAEITGKINCCSSGRGKIAVGCDDGTVGLIDRSFKLSGAFQAHSSEVLFLQQLKQKNILVTVGDDKQPSVQQSSICLKVFDLDKVQEEGSSSTTPFCVQILRIFTNQFPEAKITSFLVLEESPPIIQIAIGLDSGAIYCIKGDIARERITRFKLQVESGTPNPGSGKTGNPITGLGFRAEGRTLQLFAVTSSSVSLFDLDENPPKRQTLDGIGCEANAVSMSDRLDLIIGRPEAVYFYEIDGRGPCWAFDGEKKFLGWFRGYLLSIISDPRNPKKNTFNIYDLRNRLIANSMQVGEVSHMLNEWGYVILIMNDKKVLCVGEKDMESKLDMLFKKNLYTVAINLVQSQQADLAATSEVLRKYGDHLYLKQEYDDAMNQYINTIGYLEPSYVIQKFLDAQRIHNLTNYLEKLHDRGLASKDHTTLLLNCYTKLKDVEKLNQFIKDEDGTPGEHKFDVETAIRVCRAAGYHEHAMFVAKKSGRHELYLKILLEDLGRYDEALKYIASLALNQAGYTVKEYGKILVEHRPAETVEILLNLCCVERESNGGEELGFSASSPMDFVNIFVHYPKYLIDFLEKYVQRAYNPSELVEIHNTLLELYLSNDMSFPSLSQENGFEFNLVSISNGSNKPKEKDPITQTNERERVERQTKGLTLLKSAWPSQSEDPLYDVDLALILCETNKFKPGLLFLYERMKLYKEVISCYMQAHDHQGLISCCTRLADSATGGDPTLWADLLKYFGELGTDCSKEVKEVLGFVEKEDVLSPILVLQTLAKNPCLTLSVVKDYIARKLEEESRFIDEDRKSIDKYKEETDSMRKEISDLQSNAKIFQLSKCTTCNFTLDLPAVHFMCMHSFHLHCLGDNEKECPACASEYRQLAEEKGRMEMNGRDHEVFFGKLKGSKDGFGVVAEYFGKGIVSKTVVGDEIGR